MITLHTHIDSRNKEELNFVGLSTDIKPTDKFGSTSVTNGSTFFEMNTGKVFIFDESGKKRNEV